MRSKAGKNDDCDDSSGIYMRSSGILLDSSSIAKHSSGMVLHSSGIDKNGNFGSEEACCRVASIVFAISYKSYIRVIYFCLQLFSGVLPLSLSGTMPLAGLVSICNKFENSGGRRPIQTDGRCCEHRRRFLGPLQ